MEKGAMRTVDVEYHKNGTWSFVIDPHIKVGLTELKYKGDNFKTEAAAKREANRILKKWHGKYKIIVKR